MAQPGLRVGRIRRHSGTDPVVRSASAHWRILTWIIKHGWAACPSLDWTRNGASNRTARRGPLVHQSAGHGGRPDVRIADAVLPLRCDRDVGHFRCRALGRIPPTIGPPAANLATRPHDPGSGHRRRRTDPCHPRRGDDGDGVEGCPVRSGVRSDHQGHDRPTSMAHASDAALITASMTNATEPSAAGANPGSVQSLPLPQGRAGLLPLESTGTLSPCSTPG